MDEMAAGGAQRGEGAGPVGADRRLRVVDVESDSRRWRGRPPGWRAPIELVSQWSFGTGSAYTLDSFPERFGNRLRLGLLSGGLRQRFSLR